MSGNELVKGKKKSFLGRENLWKDLGTGTAFKKLEESQCSWNPEKECVIQDDQYVKMKLEDHVKGF